MRSAFSVDDADLLARALRHRSAGGANNERLEFLGDAVLALLIAEALHDRWPKADEGALTRARAQLVCEPSLAAIARSLQLGERLELGPGELKSGGVRRDSILADALEALIGAHYLEGGLDRVRAVVLPWFEQGLAAMPAGKAVKDPKTRLQEWLQARGWARPQYTLLEASGPDHARQFRVSAVAGEPSSVVEGKGGSLRSAEQQAAEALLAALHSAHDGH